MLEMRLLLKKIETLLKDHFSDHSSKFDYEYALLSFGEMVIHRIAYVEESFKEKYVHIHM